VLSATAAARRLRLSAHTMPASSALATAMVPSGSHGGSDGELSLVDGASFGLVRAGEAGAGAEVVGVCSSG
jgi:hypothetical protein